MKNILIVIILNCLFFSAIAQIKKDTSEIVATKSFISKDNLTRLYKASMESGFFGSKDGVYSFNASLFGIMALVSPKVKIDTLILNRVNRRFRKIELMFKLAANEENKISSFSPGLKIGLINKRDYTDGTLQGLMKDTETAMRVASRTFVNAEKRYIRLNKKDSLVFKKLIKKFQDDKPPILKDFDEEFQKLFLEEWLKLKPELDYLKLDFSDINAANFNEYLDKVWANDKERISRRALLTFEALPEFANSTLNSLNLELKFLKGLNVNKIKKDATNLELFATYNSSNDTINVEDNFDERVTWDVGATLGRVLKSDSKGNSFLEIASGIEFEKIVEGIRVDEDTNNFKFNFKLTSRLTKDVYLPIEIKYDPSNSNVFGFLSLTWNFSNNE